ncbi:MAG: hypothetical protein ACE5I9_04810 [Candidatus Methylomirabilales bacterium]
MGIEDYFNAQIENLRRSLRFEPFAVLFPIVEELYTTSVRLIPPDKSPVFGQFFLICHKSFLAAASLIGQAQPDDAAPITRRAIEVIRLAAAVKTNPANAKKWLAFEERMRRWKDRGEGKKPKPLRISLEVNHPLVTELMETWGILSDASVHFTPEYFDSLSWRRGDNTLFLNYFTEDQRVIEREIILLTAAHAKILRVLDWCLDGAFSSHDEWQRLMAEGHERGKPFAAKFEPTIDENSGDESSEDNDGRET